MTVHGIVRLVKPVHSEVIYFMLLVLRAAVAVRFNITFLLVSTARHKVCSNCAHQFIEWKTPSVLVIYPEFTKPCGVLYYTYLGTQ